VTQVVASEVAEAAAGCLADSHPPAIHAAASDVSCRPAQYMHATFEDRRAQGL